MEIFLNGVKNFLQMVNDNWTTIMVVAGLGVAVFKKIKDWAAKSEEEKIAIAKEQIGNTILKMITDAENNTEWVKAGQIKRAEVIDVIYTKYPILSKVKKQEELIAFIDKAINDALVTLREVVEQNKVVE
ncbi:MAG: hypothetical protein PUC73_05455 [Lachnospiraceae bacterium]|nr:hypothetical protein [Lachnospiraceae bacterium]